VVRVVDALSTRRLGRQLASHASQALADSARQQLQQLIRNYAETLNREERMLHLMLAMQAEEVERRLAAEPPSDPPRTWGVADFDEPTSTVPGLVTSGQHGVTTGEGGMRPQRVSYETQVIRVAPDAGAEAAEDVARLADMTEAYRTIRDHFPEAVLWQYTSLAGGVHSSYPGKGGYPADYEPRRRPWYTHAAERNETTWLPPSADLTTGRATMTMAEPVHGPDGTVAGVTAIDVPVTAVLGRPRVHADWAEQSRRYLVSIEQVGFMREIGLKVEPGVIGEVPLVIAESSAEPTRSDWRRPTKLRPLRTDDPSEVDRIVEQIHAGESGAMTVHRGGQEQLWAWGVIGESRSLAVLVSVPRDAILADADRMESEALGAMVRSLQRSALLVVFVVGAVLIVAWRGSRTVSRPVMEMAEAAHRVADGDFEQRVTIRQRIPDELSEMAEAFNEMVPQLRERFQLRQSLNLAMEVQQSLLPSRPPAFEGVDVAGRSVYCDETGGDYYDFLEFEPFGSKQLAVVIGDVVGHGIAAALLMATTRALLRSRVALPGSLEQVFNDVNAQLCAGAHGGRFMTMFYLLIDTESRLLRWLSAGHDPAIVYDPATERFDDLVGEDIPLGLDRDWRYRELSAAGWNRGSIIVIGTDGIWEARNRTGAMFGKDRLRRIIAEHAQLTSDAITRKIHEQVRQFRGSVDQQDDITLVVIKMTE